MRSTLEKIILLILKYSAKFQLWRVKPTVIGITGSAGKTSAVRATGLILSAHFPTRVAKKGNSETGLPLEILDIPVRNYENFDWLWVALLAISKAIFTKPTYKYLILEMGIDSDQSPKNMDYLLDIVKPDIGVLLNINQVHGQNFTSKNTLQAIAREKCKLLLALPENGLAIYNADQVMIESELADLKAKKKRFSLIKRSTYQLLKYQVGLEGTTFVFLASGDQYQIKLDQRLFTKSSFGSFASALIVAEHLGIKIKEAIKILEADYQSPPGRLSLIEGINQSYLIDSSYNSSLEPALSSLEMLDLISIRGKKIAILGDMREIGPGEADDHRALAKRAVQVADELILIGPLTKKYMLPKLKQLKFSSKKIHHFSNAYQAIEPVKSLVKPHDLILLKGSQNTIFLEILTKALMLNSAQAKKMLARQNQYWEKQRRKLLS